MVIKYIYQPSKYDGYFFYKKSGSKQSNQLKWQIKIGAETNQKNESNWKSIRVSEIAENRKSKHKIK